MGRTITAYLLTSQPDFNSGSGATANALKITDSSGNQITLASNEYPVRVTISGRIKRGASISYYDDLCLCKSDRSNAYTIAHFWLLGGSAGESILTHNYIYPEDNSNDRYYYNTLQGTGLQGASLYICDTNAAPRAIHSSGNWTIKIYTEYTSASISFNINNPNWGSATLSSTAAISAGGTVTVTITPNSGFITEFVMPNHGSIEYTGDGYFYTYKMPNQVQAAIITIIFRPQVNTEDIITKDQMDLLRTHNNNVGTAVTQGAVATAAIANTYKSVLKTQYLPILSKWYNGYIWDDGDTPATYNAATSPSLKSLIKNGNANTQLVIRKYGCIVMLRIQGKNSSPLNDTIAQGGEIATFPSSCRPTCLVQFTNISMAVNRLVIQAGGTSLTLHDSSATTGNWINGSVMYIAEDSNVTIQRQNIAAADAKGLEIQLRRVGHIASISVHGRATSTVNNWGIIVTIPDTYRPQDGHNVFMRNIYCNHQDNKNGGLYLEPDSSDSNKMKLRVGNMNMLKNDYIYCYACYIAD